MASRQAKGRSAGSGICNASNMPPVPAALPSREFTWRRPFHNLLSAKDTMAILAASGTVVSVQSK